MLAFMSSKQLDGDAQYAARGRKHKDLSDEALFDEWMIAFTQMAQAPSELTFAANDDLQSEINLRGLDPPYPRVEEAFRLLQKKAREASERIKTDPDKDEKMVEFLAEFDNFIRDRDRSS